MHVLSKSSELDMRFVQGVNLEANTWFTMGVILEANNAFSKRASFLTILCMYATLLTELIINIPTHI